MKKYLFFGFFLLTVQFFLPAQTAQEMEELLNTKAVSYEQAARFVLKAADVLNPAGGDGFYSRADAFRLSADRKWLPKEAAGGDEARLEGVSLLIMRSFVIKGGLFYSIFKNPHYAYRELVYMDIIQGRTDPEMAVSGELLMFLLGRALAFAESTVQENRK